MQMNFKTTIEKGRQMQNSLFWRIPGNHGNHSFLNFDVSLRTPLKITSTPNIIMGHFYGNKFPPSS